MFVVVTFPSLLVLAQIFGKEDDRYKELGVELRASHMLGKFKHFTLSYINNLSFHFVF